MAKTLIRVLAPVVIAIAALSSHSSAGAGKATAVYTGLDAGTGILSVTGQAQSHFCVLGQMPDGTYAPVFDGLLGDQGQCTVLVPHVGPTKDGCPQYAVEVDTPSGDSTTVFGVAADPSEEWWLD